MATFVDPLYFDANGMGQPFPPQNLFIEDRTDAFIVMRTLRDLTPTITGTGSLRATGQHTLTVETDYRVEIQTGGYTAEATFRWSNDGGSTWIASDIPVSTAYLGYYELEFGVEVQFSSDGIFVSGDFWDFVAIALADQVYDLNVDTTTSTVQVGNTLEIFDSDFSLTRIGANPLIYLDHASGSADYLSFDRSTNFLNFGVANVDTHTFGPNLTIIPGRLILKGIADPGTPSSGTPWLYASTADIPIWQNSNDVEYPILLGGTVNATSLTIDSIVLQSAAKTLTSLNRLVDINSTITLNYAAPSVIGYAMRGTVEYQQAGGAVNLGVPFLHQGTWKNQSGANVAVASMLAFADAGTISADGQTLTTAVYRSFNSSPTVTRSNAGAMTVTELTGFDSAATVGAGSTVTTRTAFRVEEATATGTLTNQYGVDIPALSAAGTLNVGIRNADAYRGTKYMSLLGSTTTPGNVTAGDFSSIRANIGENVAISGNAQLVVRQATVGNEVMSIISTATNDDPAERLYQGRVTTTDATVTTINTVACPNSTTTFIHAVITGRRTGGTAGTAEDLACYIRYAAFQAAAGTATQVGVTTGTSSIESQAGFNATISASGGNALVQVTGATDNNMVWHSTIRVYQVAT